MIICLFGQRYKDDANREKEAQIGTMLLDQLSRMEGFVSYHMYTADDGEVLGVIRFDSKEALEAWRDDSLHRSIWHHAPSFYEYFWIQNTETYREYVWTPGGRTGEDMRERFRSESANLYSGVESVVSLEAGK